MIRQCRKCKRVLEVNSVNFVENKNSSTGYMTTRCKRCKSGNIVTRGKRLKIEHDFKINYKQVELTIKHNSARTAVYYAVRNGTLPRVKTLTCVCCNKQSHLYHHWSYEKEYQTDVIPLCRSCHWKVHDLLKCPISSKQIDVSIML